MIKRILAILCLSVTVSLGAGSGTWHYVQTDGTNFTWLGGGTTNPASGGFQDLTVNNSFSVYDYIVFIKLGDNLSTMITNVNTAYFLEPGTHTITADVVQPSNSMVIGYGWETTRIDDGAGTWAWLFATNAGSVRVEGIAFNDVSQIAFQDYNAQYVPLYVYFKDCWVSTEYGHYFSLNTATNGAIIDLDNVYLSQAPWAPTPVSGAGGGAGWYTAAFKANYGSWAQWISKTRLSANESIVYSNIIVTANAQAQKFMFPLGDYLIGNGTNLFYITSDLSTTNSLTSN